MSALLNFAPAHRPIYIDFRASDTPIPCIDIAYGNGVFCGIFGNQSIISADGISWVMGGMLDPIPSATSICWNGSMFCVIGADNVETYLCATSPDGITWTPRLMPSTGGWSGITFGGGKFVAVGTGITAASSDGVNWTGGTIPYGGWTGIAYGSGVYCTMANNNTNTSATSTDGLTWSLGTLPVVGYWRSIASNGTMFIAIMQANSSAVETNIYATSPDGATWTQRQLPFATTWNDVIWNGTHFAVFGYGNFAAISSNGIDWIVRGMPSGNYSWYASAWDGIEYCVVSVIEAKSFVIS